MKRRLTALAALAFGIAAGPAFAQYAFQTTIPVPPSPDNSVGGKFATYDISFFDPTSQLDYVADRSNASVDIFSAATNSFVGRIGGTGQVLGGQLDHLVGDAGLRLGGRGYRLNMGHEVRHGGDGLHRCQERVEPGDAEREVKGVEPVKFRAR